MQATSRLGRVRGPSVPLCGGRCPSPRRLDRFPALAGVDLEVARGEIVLLRGPNGAGKTTLMRTCAGLSRIAAVLARRPELWLLDEPHAGLDRAGRDLVDGLVRDAAAAGATVLFASHELDRAEGLATRIVTIAGGLVREDTTAGIGAGRAG